MKVILNRLIIIFFLCTLFVKCSSLSDNFTSSNQFYLKGGVSSHKEWNDSLIFKQTSWFKELNLLFDVLISPIDLKSPFSNWLSSNEKTMIAQCHQAFYLLIYDYDSELTSGAEFLEQMKQKGLRTIYLPQFKKSLQLHPDHLGHSLHLYSFYALCQKSPSNIKRIDTVIPGYKSVIIYP